MNQLRSFFVPVGGLAILALLLTLAAPRAVHAIAAALVQVVNTTANPAITQDTSKQASQIVTLTCNPAPVPAIFTCFQIDGRGENLTSNYSVPLTTQFVLTGLDYYPFFNTSVGSGTIYISNNAVDSSANLSIYEGIVINNLAQQASFQFPSGIVMGSTAQPVITGPSIGTISNAIVTLHGYLSAN
jgi:hypothetical protein